MSGSAVSEVWTDVFPDPNLSAPLFRFNTGLVASGVEQYYPNLPPITGSLSPWTITEWGKQQNLDPGNVVYGAPALSPGFSSSLYSWTTSDGLSKFEVDRNAQDGSYTYNLFSANGALTDGGGTNVFLQVSSAQPGSTTLDHPIEFSLTAAIDQAYASYQNSSAKATGAVLAQVFAGFVIQFNYPGSSYYDPSLRTYTSFIQIGISNSATGYGPNGVWFSDSLLSGGTTIGYGNTLRGDPSLAFSDATSSTTLTYSINSYLEAMIALASDLPAAAHDLSRWTLNGMYIGLETENTDSRTSSITNGPQGNIAVGLSISNLSVKEDLSSIVVPNQTGIYTSYHEYSLGSPGGPAQIWNKVSGEPVGGSLTVSALFGPNDLWFSRYGYNLNINILGMLPSGSGSTGVSIINWFNADEPQSALQYIVLADGSKISDSQVATLTQAMDIYQHYNPGFNWWAVNNMPQDTALNQALESGWARVFYASATISILDSPIGNNVLCGTNPNTTYKMGIGYGQDIIWNGLAGQTLQSGTLDLGPGINQANIWMSRAYYNLNINVIGSGTGVSIINWFNSGTPAAGIESIVFSDGSQINNSQITQIASAMAAYDVSSGPFSWWLAGQSPFDPTVHPEQEFYWSSYIGGTSGNDTLGSQYGNDIIKGGGGQDTYLLGPNFGRSEIWNGVESDARPNGTLAIGMGLTPGDIWLSRTYNNLNVNVIGQYSGVSIINWFNTATPWAQVSNFRLSDGSYITSAQVNDLVSAMSQYQADHPQFDWSSAVSIPFNIDLNNSMQNDWSRTITGSASSDYFNTTYGNDTFIGYGQSAQYVFGACYGVDKIVNGTVEDNIPSGELDFNIGITPENLWLDRTDQSGNVSSSGNNLRFIVCGTDSSITVANWFSPVGNYGQIDIIKLLGSGEVLAHDISTLLLAMGSFEDHYAAQHGGATFDPSGLGNSTIVDPNVLHAIMASWHG